MRKQPRKAGWYVLSGALHVGVLWLTPGEKFELPRRGTMPATEGPSASSQAFAALDPIEAVDIRMAEVTREVAPTEEPVEEEQPEETPDEVASEATVAEELSLEDLLEIKPTGVRAGNPRDLRVAASGGGGGGEGTYTSPVARTLLAQRYPDDAPGSDRPLTVGLRIYVTAVGVPRDVVLERPAPVDILNQLAVEAARRAEFSPATRDGRPVGAWVSIGITFTPER